MRGISKSTDSFLLVLCSSSDPRKLLKDHLELEFHSFSHVNGAILNSRCSYEAELWGSLLLKPSERATTSPGVLPEQAPND